MRCNLRVGEPSETGGLPGLSLGRRSNDQYNRFPHLTDRFRINADSTPGESIETATDWIRPEPYTRSRVRWRTPALKPAWLKYDIWLSATFEASTDPCSSSGIGNLGGFIVRWGDSYIGQYIYEMLETSTKIQLSDFIELILLTGHHHPDVCRIMGVLGTQWGPRRRDVLKTRPPTVYTPSRPLFGV